MLNIVGVLGVSLESSLWAAGYLNRTNFHRRSDPFKTHRVHSKTLPRVRDPTPLETLKGQDSF